MGNKSYIERKMNKQYLNSSYDYFMKYKLNGNKLIALSKKSCPINICSK